MSRIELDPIWVLVIAVEKKLLMHYIVYSKTVHLRRVICLFLLSEWFESCVLPIG